MFSVLWIMTGVLLFGIVTSEMTRVLMETDMPPEPDIVSMDIGILRYREYDAHYVAENGGENSLNFWHVI